MAQACVTSASVLALTENHPEVTAGALLDVIVLITCSMITQAFDVWGDLADEGHRTLAAHFAVLIMSGSGGASGPVTSRTIDKLSESYAAGAFDDAELGSTEFGQLHLLLLGSLRTQRAVSDGDEAPDWALPDRRIA